MTPVYVGNVVVSGQTFVKKRVVRAQQVKGAPILPQLALDEQLSLTLQRLAQVVVKLRKQCGVRRHEPHVSQVQPLAGKIAHQRRRAVIVQHSPNLLLQDRWLTERAAHPRGPRSSSSGMLLHKKNDNRDASSRLLI